MWESLVAELRHVGIAFSPGMTDAEVAATESRFGFRFPPDLRAFLQVALPCGEQFPDWRSERTGDEAVLRDWLDLPLRGLLFDIEYNGFWLDEWGPRPTTLEEASRVVTRLVDEAPRLIPIFSHRMMPDEPHLPGNPVFSVHQTDIICYGVDLRGYLTHEFLSRADGGDWHLSDEFRRIAFWDIERFQSVRWSSGPCSFDNNRGQLPPE